MAVKNDKVPRNPTAGIEFYPKLNKGRKEYIPTRRDVDRILLFADPMNQRFIACQEEEKRRAVESISKKRPKSAPESKKIGEPEALLSP